MIEHFNADIDLVQHDDGSWRADKYPKEGTIIKTSRFDSYPSRTAVIFAMRNDPDFWKDA